MSFLERFFSRAEPHPYCQEIGLLRIVLSELPHVPDPFSRITFVTEENMRELVSSSRAEGNYYRFQSSYPLRDPRSIFALDSYIGPGLGYAVNQTPGNSGNINLEVHRGTNIPTNRKNIS